MRTVSPAWRIRRRDRLIPVRQNTMCYHMKAAQGRNKYGGKPSSARMGNASGRRRLFSRATGKRIAAGPSASSPRGNPRSAVHQAHDLVQGLQRPGMLEDVAPDVHPGRTAVQAASPTMRTKESKSGRLGPPATSTGAGHEDTAAAKLAGSPEYGTLTRSAPNSPPRRTQCATSVGIQLVHDLPPARADDRQHRQAVLVRLVRGQAQIGEHTVLQVRCRCSHARPRRPRPDAGPREPCTPGSCCTWAGRAWSRPTAAPPAARQGPAAPHRPGRSPCSAPRPGPAGQATPQAAPGSRRCPGSCRRWPRGPWAESRSGCSWPRKIPAVCACIRSWTSPVRTIARLRAMKPPTTRSTIRPERPAALDTQPAQAPAPGNTARPARPDPPPPDSDPTAAPPASPVRPHPVPGPASRRAEGPSAAHGGGTRPGPGGPTGILARQSPRAGSPARRAARTTPRPRTAAPPRAAAVQVQPRLRQHLQIHGLARRAASRTHWGLAA